MYSPSQELTQTLSRLNSEFSSNRSHRYLQYLAQRELLPNIDHPYDDFSRYVRSTVLTIDGVNKHKRHSDRMRAINKSIGDLYLDKVSLESAEQARLDRKAAEKIELNIKRCLDKELYQSLEKGLNSSVDHSFTRNYGEYLNLDVSNSYRRKLQTEKRREILSEADRVLNESVTRASLHDSSSYKRDLNLLGMRTGYRATRVQSPVNCRFRRETPRVSFMDYPGSNYASRSKQLCTEMRQENSNSTVPFYSEQGRTATLKIPRAKRAEIDTLRRTVTLKF